ncbi:hypothetical protein DFQ28_002138 [Apophysomyces sp. BC1034]|nr:hypothetical protein DFQ28_002138 [Apophysomyces sp. BC1034]
MDITADTSKTVVNDKTAEREIDFIKDAYNKLTEMLVSIPDDAQWCLDNSRHLIFRKFIEKFDFLDKCSSQQRNSNILTNLSAKTSAIAQATTNGADYQETSNGATDGQETTSATDTQEITSVDTHNNGDASFQFDLISPHH